MAFGHYSLREIQNYEMLSPAPPFEGRAISKESALRILRRLNRPDNLPLTEDKLLFSRICGEHCLPCPATLATISHGTATPEPNMPVEAPPGIVAKPVDGAYGRGILFLDRRGDRYIGGSLELPVEDWPKALASRLPRDETWLVQTRYRPHRVVRKLSGSEALTTYRVGTYRAPGSDNPEIIFQYLRLAGPGSLLDNFAWARGGNAIVTLNAEGDRLQDVLTYNAAVGRLESTWVHPWTDEQLHGIPAPLAEECRGLACNAARAFAPLRAVGWDIGISEDGPVLIEGNAHFDPPFASIFPADGWRRLAMEAHR